MQFDDRNISLKLSEVLREIGVSERMVKLRRKCALLKESLGHLSDIYLNTHAKYDEYNFGSQSEGTTTLGLSSDIDVLICDKSIHVIQDRVDWKRDVTNLLIVQDEQTSPGYCILQLLRRNEPLPETDVVNGSFKSDDKGRILLPNPIFHFVSYVEGATANGPAGTLEGFPGRMDTDVIFALHCDSWPVEGRDWLDRHNVGSWPSMDLKQFAKSKGFFLVPASSKSNNLHDFEWRISTSMAERLMMFNANITQIGCYVMMKIICKTFLIMDNGEKPITSFMCKCTLFYCIENTHAYFWREENLLPCLMKCLSLLHDRVQTLNCPHYIIPTNNIMAQRITPRQQRYVLNILDSLVHPNIDMYFAIEINDIGKRLHMKVRNIALPPVLPSMVDNEIDIVGSQLFNFKLQCSELPRRILRVLSQLGLSEAASKVLAGILRLQSQYHTLNDVGQQARTLFSPQICSLVGSLLASFSVGTRDSVSPDAIWWFREGFESDVSSSRLKLASAYYCANDMINAELILREVEVIYKTDIVATACCCCAFERQPLPDESLIQVYRNNEMLNKLTAFCVTFIRCESAITPQELRQELFRSTEAELQTRSFFDKHWMDFAVVDSLPFLYFLQYNTYKKLGMRQKQRQALSYLLRTTSHTPNLGHGETAWNLLGQCMEQENLPQDARWCYQRSIEIRPDNNAANFHLVRLPRF